MPFIPFLFIVAAGSISISQAESKRSHIATGFQATRTSDAAVCLRLNVEGALQHCGADGRDNRDGGERRREERPLGHVVFLRWFAARPLRDGGHRHSHAVAAQQRSAARGAAAARVWQDTAAAASVRAQVSGRADDADPAIIQNRIDTYNISTAPVAAFYKAQGKLKEINGVGSIEEIFERLCVAINA